MSTDYGVRHPDGRMTVQADGHPFPARILAEQEAAKCDAGNEFGHCEDCGEDAGKRKHRVAARPSAVWPPADFPADAFKVDEARAAALRDGDWAGFAGTEEP